MGFDKWDKEIHYENEQLKRICSARKISDNNIIDVDTENRKCVIQGDDGEYRVTLNKCDCTDFRTRKLPCKHMYWLADVLGELDNLPGLDTAISEYRFWADQGEQLSLLSEEQKEIRENLKKEEITPNMLEKGTLEYRSCDKYKQCSLEGKCIQSPEISEHCVYKTHLEKGEIYYTRASERYSPEKYFSQEKYDEIENHFISLSSMEKEAFLELVGYVIYIRRCAKHFLCTKKEDNFKNVYSCMRNGSPFLVANPYILVGLLFDKNIMSIQNCQVFCDKYSDIPFSTAEIELPSELQYNDKDYISGAEHLIKNLNKQGKEKQEKQNGHKLKKWQEFFLKSGTSALYKLQDFFAYIDFKQNYAIAMEEWAENHKENIPVKLSDLKYIAIEYFDKDGKIVNSYKKLECFVK